MPEPKRHAENRNWAESILRRIPGFRGYLEKEYRRESDELQRTWLVDRLERSKRGLNERARDLASAAQLDALPQLEQLRSRLDRLIGRIRGAMQGYSGFFSLVQVDEKVLDRVYEFDVALMEQVSQLADGIESLATKSDPIETLVASLKTDIESLEDAWDRREDILKGLE